MKYHISISKKEIFTAVILIVGFILLFKGIHSAYRYNHALNLETLNERGLKEGTYVTGNINSYIGQIMYGSNKFNGVSMGWVTLGKTYEFYTIPIEGGSYIALMISDASVIEKLNAFDNGYGEGVYFEGIIIEPPTELNYKWYEHVEGFNMESLIDSVVIQEANLKGKNTTYLGFLLIVIASLIFFSSGGIKNVVMEETDNSGSVYNNYAKLYSKDNELRAEQMQLETLEKRLLSMKRTCILCPFILAFGIYMIYQFHLLIGIMLIITSISNAWNYFINSANTLAKSLVRRLTLKSISIQIEEHRQNIERLQEKE